MTNIDDEIDALYRQIRLNQQKIEELKNKWAQEREAVRQAAIIEARAKLEEEPEERVINVNIQGRLVLKRKPNLSREIFVDKVEGLDERGATYLSNYIKEMGGCSQVFWANWPGLYDLMTTLELPISIHNLNAGYVDDEDVDDYDDDDDDYDEDIDDLDDIDLDDDEEEDDYDEDSW